MMENEELFIGLVGATGTDLTTSVSAITESLSDFGFEVVLIKFSDFFEDPYFKTSELVIDKSTRYSEILSQMEAGNLLRKKFGANSILARFAVQTIRATRQKVDKKRAFIFQSLKNSAESEFLRETYGLAYYQIGVFSAQGDRIKFLEKQKGIKTSDAHKLIEKDIADEQAYGQQTRDTFQLSDIFVKTDLNNAGSIAQQISRIIDLLFGHPHITPTLDEHMMYTAFTYSSRSADLSRQVGAVLVNSNSDIIGLGSNDVPKFQGGPYWPELKSDWRDYKIGVDANEKIKNEIIVRVMRKLGQTGTDESILSTGLKVLDDTGLTDLTEFTRATHAEMSALFAANRVAASPLNGTLYCTTFPCHNCAKHIVESGVQRVVFVEPYPKSKAIDLHDDSISIERTGQDKVSFEHFIGVAARRYLDLFSLKLGMGRPLKRKIKGTGEISKFTRANSRLRVAVDSSFYFDKETFVSSQLEQNGA